MDAAPETDTTECIVEHGLLGAPRVVSTQPPVCLLYLQALAAHAANGEHPLPPEQRRTVTDIDVYVRLGEAARDVAAVLLISNADRWWDDAVVLDVAELQRDDDEEEEADGTSGGTSGGARYSFPHWRSTTHRGLPTAAPLAILILWHRGCDALGTRWAPTVVRADALLLAASLVEDVAFPILGADAPVAAGTVQVVDGGRNLRIECPPHRFMRAVMVTFSMRDADATRTALRALSAVEASAPRGSLGAAAVALEDSAAGPLGAAGPHAAAVGHGDPPLESISWLQGDALLEALRTERRRTADILRAVVMNLAPAARTLLVARGVPVSAAPALVAETAQV